jgi:hypothetical protein
MVKFFSAMLTVLPSREEFHRPQVISVDQSHQRYQWQGFRLRFCCSAMLTIKFLPSSEGIYQTAFRSVVSVEIDGKQGY